MNAAEKILTRLDGVKPSGPGRWIAQCPAHDDRAPSLSIRETDDGRILLYDFGGCPTQRVLQALGLDFGDLFDRPLGHHLPPVRGGFSARELLELSAHEALVAALLTTRAGDDGLTPEEAARLLKAASRLNTAQALANGR